MGVAVGTPFQIAIYDDVDDDFDPTTNLMLLATANGTIESLGPVGFDKFQEVVVPVTIVRRGFFVAVILSGTSGSQPAKVDQSVSLQSSWFAENNVVGGLDIEDPFGSASNSGLIDAFGMPGNFLVRASTRPCILGDVNLDGVVDLLDIAPFVNHLMNGTYQCEADINL